MTSDQGNHEKIRFSRKEMPRYEQYPSVEAARGGAPACLRRPIRVRRWLVVPVLALLALVVVILGGIWLVGVDAIGNERLRAQAEQALTRLAGVDVDVELGRLHLGLGRRSLFALEISDVRINLAQTGEQLARADNLRIGLKAVPMLSGQLELGAVTLVDAELAPFFLPQLGQEGMGPPQGALSPQEVEAAVFGAVQRAFAITDNSGLRQLVLRNVGLRLRDKGELSDLTINQLDLLRVSEDEITFAGEAQFRERVASYEGSALRGENATAIEDLELKVTSDVPEDPLPAPGGGLQSVGSYSFVLSGNSEGPGDGSGRTGAELLLDAQINDIAVRFDDDAIKVDQVRVRTGFSGTADKFTLGALEFDMGRSQVNLLGTFGPEGADSSRYAFELVSRESRLAPVDSPEAALPFGARIAGTLDVAESVLQADSINIRTTNGELVARSALDFERGSSPGISFSLDVANMATSHVKQLWPWFSAPGARRWTLENVFGGVMQSGRISLEVPPGRLGNGVPLGPDEVSGHFELEGARFDIAGEIPPVRNGTGSVSFAGTDVEVALSSGVIYTGSGRTVQVAEGALAIRSAHLTPRIGDLDIKVDGEAAAVLELASYKPIDASRFHDLDPEALSGLVRGHVKARIPLQDGIDRDDLPWQVEFSFNDLDFAEPFQGQDIKNAKGSLRIQPDRAEVEAEAALNGMHAVISILEPLQESDLARKRDIVLKMDDAARAKHLPGLNDLVSGPIELDVKEPEAGVRDLVVDLSASRLQIPWIGWSKGKGIPATATFRMRDEDGRITLSDFRLKGESFNIFGNVSIDDGSLVDADFSQVRLTRQDDFRARVVKEGAGYRVTVRGKAMDARALVKKLIAPSKAAGEGGGSSKGKRVAVDAKLDLVHGFKGEAVSSLDAQYRVSASGIATGSVRASHSGGGAFHITKTAEQQQHQLSVASGNAGALARFLDLYGNMQGGQLAVSLAGQNLDALAGQVNVENFWIVNEPRMESLVAATDGAAKADVDSSRLSFERGAARVAINGSRLDIADGVLRGSLIGSTFQGAYNEKADMVEITGTFMPFYGLNRIFGELPVIGQILGNGRDRGLIGITYKLSGKASDPELFINPISAIAPGIFRQIFEYR
ncbi:DUF3971 domain-containing protein [Nitratireductor basaltis]|uniref:Uncharacterized protein n=1 Tax=Nitratireductor basaltis TaxID=472175 RepID=A0A084UAB5_9HYPH|nr:DUF3971 domain-containing protein [Nitratireductor basaltis]KFB09901.1 hypothetical protein EL18_00924 [Nitratireductor basaltis]